MRKVEKALESYAEGVRFPEASAFEVLELLDRRSRLAGEEQRLDAARRARLEQADSAFLRHAAEFYESLAELGDLADMRLRASVPCSHWWWYLDRSWEYSRAAA